MSEYEYDPERKLWKPGRRAFLCMMGVTMAGTVIGGPTELILPAPKKFASLAEVRAFMLKMNPKGGGSMPDERLEGGLI